MSLRNGFVKQAAQYGISEKQAEGLFKDLQNQFSGVTKGVGNAVGLATNPQEWLQGNAPQLTEAGRQSAMDNSVADSAGLGSLLTGLGGGIGALGGGALGHMTGGEDPKKKQRNALIGALLGGGVGSVAGGGLGGASGAASGFGAAEQNIGGGISNVLKGLNLQ